MQSENRPLHCAQNAKISVLSLFPTLHNVSIRRYSVTNTLRVLAYISNAERK